jgi:hypothetical protein
LSPETLRRRARSIRPIRANNRFGTNGFSNTPSHPACNASGTLSTWAVVTSTAGGLGNAFAS